MGVGRENMDTDNVPSSAVINDSEYIYDTTSLEPNCVKESAVSSITSSDITENTTLEIQYASAINKKDRVLTTDSKEKGASSSSSVECSPFLDTPLEVYESSTKKENSVSIPIDESMYPGTGSPPADLMVVNTNGFNPLQHAALRGNPG